MDLCEMKSALDYERVTHDQVQWDLLTEEIRYFDDRLCRRTKQDLIRLLNWMRDQILRGE
jgi:hypothetical protein